jgi:hypothetical protein
MADLERLRAELTPAVDDYIDTHPELLAAYQAGGFALLEAGLADQDGDGAGLGWLTPEQETQLEELQQQRGDWHAWLPGELDLRLPGWIGLGADELRAGLDGFISLLNLPFDPVVTDIMENVVQPAMQELYAQIPDMAQSLGIPPEQLKEHIDQLSDDFFADRLYAAAAEL